MKRSLLIIAAVMFFSGNLLAQNAPRQQGNTPRALPPPLPVRQVSGIVKDTTDVTVPGAVVVLKSPTDTISTSTNGDGIFVFKNVKANIFNITVTSIGYRAFVKKFTMNDAVPRLTLDPIVLKSASSALKEVVVNGTPSIVYKVDTIEYKASDYKVRPNATLDELLKKMEGFEVGSDGSVTHQGQAITKVKLNGKDYAGGDVAQAIQNLPAEIIEKAQVVDDYGDQAARSGIKDGDPQKILNVTTKADRSVGNTGRLTAQAGNNDRYYTQLYLQRINANQVITVIGNLKKTVTGVQSTGLAGSNNNGGASGGGDPGTTQSFTPNFSYRDQYGPKVQVNSNINYGFTKNDSYTQSNGIQNVNNPLVVAPSSFSNNGTNKNNSYRRGGNIEFDYSIDSLNYLQIQPNYSYSTAERSSTSFNDSKTYYYTDNTKTANYLIHQVQTGTQSSQSPNTQFGILALFNHRFRTPQRNFSAQISYNRTETESNGQNMSHTLNYADTSTNAFQANGTANLISDRPANLITYRTNNTDILRGSMTYSEPLSKLTRVEFNGQITNNSHYTKSVTDSVLANGSTKETDLLYNYTTTETRLSLNYRYSGTKVNLSLGATATPYYISGTKLNNNVGSPVTKNDFRILPIFRFAYQWSRTQRLTLSYSGSYQEPQFQQIQPFTDNTNPNNIIIGNPDLRVALNNTIAVAYNNYFPNSRFNISFNGNVGIYTAQITTNLVQGRIPIFVNGGTTPAGYRIVDSTFYVNLSGSNSVGGNYNISKQLSDRRYNLQLNGSVSYSYSVSENANVIYHQTSWDFNERFGPRITPSDNVEVNPFIGTDLRRTFATTVGEPTSKSLTNSLGLDGRFYFLKTYQVHYDASKRFITQSISQNGSPSSIPPITNNPLVIDGGFQKEFGQRRQFTLTFDVFDILHQNNFVVQSVTTGGVTNTISSSLSRYFLIGFRLNLQKWSGRPQRGGRDMQRRGDGSFIYN